MSDKSMKTIPEKLSSSVFPRSQSDISLEHRTARTHADMPCRLMPSTHADLQLNATNVARMEAKSMRSYAVLKATATSSKCMHVELYVSNNILRISILQKQQGKLCAFSVVNLQTHGLVVCWKWKHEDAFAICCEENGALSADIWCFVSCTLRNKWLAILRRKGVRVAHISALKQVPLLKPCAENQSTESCVSTAAHFRTWALLAIICMLVMNILCR